MICTNGKKILEKVRKTICKSAFFGKTVKNDLYKWKNFFGKSEKNDL